MHWCPKPCPKPFPKYVALVHLAQILSYLPKICRIGPPTQILAQNLSQKICDIGSPCPVSHSSISAAPSLHISPMLSWFMHFSSLTISLHILLNSNIGPEDNGPTWTITISVLHSIVAVPFGRESVLMWPTPELVRKLFSTISNILVRQA